LSAVPGAFTRAVAAVMLVHFLVALGMVHVGLPFSAWSVDARRG
jgi:hypothetical protein